MGQWYEGNRRLFRKERETLAAACPLLRLAVVGEGFKINNACNVKRECAIVHGVYVLDVPDTDRQLEYGIVLAVPDNYPKGPPELFCNDPRLPVGNIDRHIMTDGRACLAVQAETGRRWPPGSMITDFLENLVAPFLVWQAYYEAYGKPPPWGDLAHGIQGIRQYYAKLLGRSADDSSVIDFMRLLARKNRPKGHERCPCNSGRKLRDCHRDLIYEIRERIAWNHAKDDLAFLVQAKSKKA